MASWFSGSGLGGFLKSIVGNRDFQSSMLDMLRRTAQKLLENRDDPAKVELIARNLSENAEVVVGAVVKGTEAERLVSRDVVAQAEELRKAHGGPDISSA